MFFATAVVLQIALELPAAITRYIKHQTGLFLAPQRIGNSIFCRVHVLSTFAAVVYGTTVREYG